MKATVYSHFDLMPVKYERLFASATIDSFFFGLPWFRNLIKNGMDVTDELRVYCIEADRCPTFPIGMLPMRFSRQPSPWTSPVMLRALANYYTPLFGPILDKSYPNVRDVVKELIRELCCDSHTWDAVDLKPLSLEVTNIDDIVAGFRETGWIAQRYFCFGNWFLKVEGRSFLSYFDALPSALKHTIVRKRKKVEAGSIRLTIITDEKDLDESINAYQQVYNGSWKQPEPYGDFMPGLIRSCAKEGSLRLGLAYIEGHPAAAQVWIVEHGVASIYKLAYQEKYSHYSVGSILTAYMMEYAIEVDRVQEVDYLTGDDGYKRDWMSHRRERYGVRAFNPRTVRGMLGISRHIGGGALKRSWLKLTNP
jgi:Acetyltransferase (GNAT) domain